MVSRKKIPEKKDQELVVEKPSVPSISFSESEVQKVADFINHCYQFSEFKGSMKDLSKISKMFNEMHGHVSKLEGYILEFRKVTQAPSKE